MTSSPCPEPPLLPAAPRTLPRIPGHGQALPKCQSSAFDTLNWTQLRHLVCGQSQSDSPRREASAFIQWPGTIPASHVLGRASCAHKREGVQLWPVAGGTESPCCAQATYTASVQRAPPGLAQLQPLHIPSTQHKGGHPLPGTSTTLPHSPTILHRLAGSACSF